MKILVCGSRGWREKAPIRTIIRGYGPKAVIIHGAADGADRIAGWVAQDLGLEQIVVPANWERYGKGAGPVRNQEMLDKHKPDVVWAFRTYGRSRGTDDMVRRAEAAGIPTFVVSGGPRPKDSQGDEQLTLG